MVPGERRTYEQLIIALYTIAKTDHTKFPFRFQTRALAVSMSHE